ncbi:DNA starvation/stationary phase protection protein [Lactobacillus sp. CBA3606]|uniref:ferritin-like domain-containing protein n=1 Tax=Lactobacillus sp. CBA3606 TaxID=2099789 RepID=UPI000CFBF0AC|nr:ferritin-like domain-containing protein [Lactobacillus sp. CBA3606]AVK63986.1 DNA starvation/stationary phase protection protein [Lactobacillus sp. CBA3606]
MSDLTMTEKYAAELKQSELDHKLPTAGAMTNHILANLMVEYVKLNQIKWYVQGPDSLALRTEYDRLIVLNTQNFAALADLLLDEDQKPSSTTAELVKYTMLTEDGAFKYADAKTMVAATVKDFDTENLFTDRAIKLAVKEDRPALAAWLTAYRGSNNRQIRQLQAFLGHTARTGLDEEDEDDD